MESTELMHICLATGNEYILDLICTIPIVLYDITRHAIALHITFWIINKLSYDAILGMDWLKSTNSIIDWLVCSMELTVGDL